jgi:type II secretion system protein I
MNRKGYLLVEVLIALSILAIGILAVTRSFSTTIFANTYGKDYLLATMLAQGKLSEVESDPHLSFGTTNGNFGGTYADRRWQLEISPAPENLAKVILTVSWQRRSRDYQLRLRTLVPVSTSTQG